MAFELHHLSAQEQWDWIHRGTVTPLELAEHYLDRIARIDGSIGAFVTVTGERARDRARGLPDDVPRTRMLWGLPTADKDLYDRRGVPTRSGSRATSAEPARVDHPLVQALDDLGTVSLGKVATPEFGLNSTTEPLLASPTRNPWDTDRSPGGSSGGSAAAVAAGLLPAAVGSDGGGSVRIPAAACGLVGLKPSRGRVPAMPGRGGLGGLVVAGPITRTVADAGMILDGLVAPTGAAARQPFALVTPDPDGATGSGEAARFLAAAIRGEGRFRIGVLEGSPWDDAVDIRVDPSARAAVDAAVRAAVAVGHAVEDVRMPRVEYARWFRTAWQASAARIPEIPAVDLDKVEPLTGWLIERGRALTGLDVLDAMAGLDAFSTALIDRFSPFDIVLTPTLALPPRPLGWYSDDPERNFADQCRYSPWTSMCNVAGLPALTLPVGTVDTAVPETDPSSVGLPMGVHCIGRPGAEATLLAFGAQLERRMHWARRHPPAWEA
ncbi:amidase [Curtobacterium ammoniigenes]|uniref:amidase n=1 Tax=Curtobacterium ammoniigenes TaxID=395387 RepID=UPI00082E87BA|nr:amidase [Curtobacterium ammoniigenes]